MSAFLQRVRIPWLGVFCFGLAYAAAEAFPAIVPMAFGLPPYHPAFAPLGRLRGVILIAAAVVYAMYRVLASHPIHLPGYRKWLKTVPWSGRDPLPFGPVHPVLQDVLLVGGLMALAYADGVVDPRCVLLAALGAYTVIAVPGLLDGKRHVEILAMTWVTPLIFLAWGSMGWELSIVTALFGMALLGVKHTLARMPWAPENGSAPKVPTGWPFARLADPEPKPARRGTGVFVGLLVGWWAFAGTRAIELDGGVTGAGAATFAVVAGAVFAMARLLGYVVGHSPPCSVLGRVWTGRWVIPGYDVVFVAPACTLLAALVVSQGTRAVGLAGSVVIGATIAISLAVAVELGPGLREWRLTGHHRIRPSLPPKLYLRL